MWWKRKTLNEIFIKLFDNDSLHVRKDGCLHPSLNLVKMQALNQYTKKNSEANGSVC